MSIKRKSVPHLVLSREEVSPKIRERIDKGWKIRHQGISSEADLRKAQAEHSKWSNYNYVLLSQVFNSDHMAKQYSVKRTKIVGRIAGHSYLLEDIEDFKQDFEDDITRLEAIFESLELYDVAEASEKRHSNKHVFIVHGHDEAARESVARFVERVGLAAIILQERPNIGRTIIQKFEEEAAKVGFAIVLMTPDDLVAAKSEANVTRLRARQNVIFELGYFAGRLGRARVCILYKGDVEIPSDLYGVLYVPMDSGGSWKMQLAKEMKAAGLEIDFNKAI